MSESIIDTKNLHINLDDLNTGFMIMSMFYLGGWKDSLDENFFNEYKDKIRKDVD